MYASDHNRSKPKHAQPKTHRSRGFVQQYLTAGLLPALLLAAFLTTSGSSKPPIHLVRQVEVTSVTPAPGPGLAHEYIPPAVPTTYTYSVHRGDTLSGIASRVYHRERAWTLIYYANHLHSATIVLHQHLEIVPLRRHVPAPPRWARASTGHTSALSVSSSSATPIGAIQRYAESKVGATQFNCLLPLWNRESGWNVYAANPSGAYGIPQALPGSKMASAGSDWATDPYTQVNWGIGYIDSTYGSPCGAWSHEEAVGWY